MNAPQRMQFQPAENSLHFYVQRIDKYGTVTLTASTSIRAARAAFREQCEEEPEAHLALTQWSRVLEQREPQTSASPTSRSTS